jgi:ABC-2 type transport system permease protein
MRVILNETIIGCKLFFRERQAVFWNFVFPVFLLFLFCSVFARSAPEMVGYLLGGVIAITIMSGAFFGLGAVMVAAREQGILRRYRVTPVTGWQIVGGSLLSRYLILLVATLLQLGLAVAVYDLKLPHHVLALFVVYSVGTLSFCAVGYLIASLARTVQAANGMANVFFLLMMFLSGASIPFGFLPDWLQKLAHILPATYLVKALQSILAKGQGLEANGLNLLVLSLYLIVTGVISVKRFRWE